MHPDEAALLDAARAAELRAAHPEVSWRQAAGMRDVLIHAYDEVDLVAVHETVRRDLPALLAQLAAISPRP